MVRFVHSTHSQFHPSVAGKWLVWGTLMMLLAGVAIIVFSVFSHDALDACCNLYFQPCPEGRGIFV